MAKNKNGKILPEDAKTTANRSGQTIGDRAGGNSTSIGGGRTAPRNGSTIYTGDTESPNQNYWNNRGSGFSVPLADYQQMGPRGFVNSARSLPASQDCCSR